MKEIPIEERDGREVTHMTGRLPDGGFATIEVVSPGSPVANPAFDVTPSRLVTGIITERGIARGWIRSRCDPVMVVKPPISMPGVSVTFFS